MNKIFHNISLILLSSMSLTSCNFGPQDQNVLVEENESIEFASHASSNLMYLHDQVTRYSSAEQAFNTITKKGIVVVDYYADWCGPCRKLGSTLEQLAPEFPNVTFLKVDVDQFKGLTESIRSIPVLAFYKNGKKVKQVVGLKSKKELTELINSL